MSDVNSSASAGDWGEGGAAAPKKRRIPKWAWWGCGGGCLLVTLVVAIASFLMYRAVRDGMDEEKQWPRLQEVLAYEQRPANISIEIGLSYGADQFHLVDRESDLRAALVEYPSSGRDDYEQLLDPDFDLAGIKLVEAEAGTLTIQGREVRCLRFARIDSRFDYRGGGPGIRVDLTGDRPRPRTLELVRASDGERIEDAEVEAFLAPFQVWKEP